MVPVAAAGVDLDIVAGTGPVVAKPVRTLADAQAIRPLDAGAVQFVADAIGLLRAELGGTPLIGFAGAPFTLASYLVEGGPSRHHEKTKALMHGAPEVWHALCARLAGITLEFLRVQVRAGVAAVQLFDSWAGTLSEVDYRRFVAPHSRAVLGGLADAGVPRIHFGVGTGELLGAMAEVGADVMGVDWRTPLDVAVARLGGAAAGGAGSSGTADGAGGTADGRVRAVQGNLDPSVLFAPSEVVAAEVLRILGEGAAAPGHIFNLGHGVLPETDPDALRRVVDLVHEASAR